MYYNIREIKGEFIYLFILFIYLFGAFVFASYVKYYY